MAATHQRSKGRKRKANDSQLTTQPKRSKNLSESRKPMADDSQLPTQSIGPQNLSSVQDIRSRFVSFHETYKSNKPASDRDFIWKFLDGIENPNMSKHIQESIVAILPGSVSMKRQMRQINRQRHVNISPSATWKDFREACSKIPLHQEQHGWGALVASSPTTR